MKKFLIILSILGVGVFGFNAGVLAQDNAEDLPTETNTVDSDRRQKVQDKVNEYKENFREFISEAEKTRIAGVCRAAQTKVSTVQTRVNEAITNRQSAYADIDSRLNTLIQKLSLTAVDTAALETNLRELNSRTSEVIASLDVYSEAVGVLADMDCESDPEAFKATLEQARSYRQTVANNSKSVRDFVTDSLKPLLESIKAELTGQRDQSGEE